MTRNDGRIAYRPGLPRTAVVQARRPKTGRMGSESTLCAELTALIKAGNSPWATTMLCARDTALARVPPETINRRIYDGTLELNPADCD